MYQIIKLQNKRGSVERSKEMKLGYEKYTLMRLYSILKTWEQQLQNTYLFSSVQDRFVKIDIKK